MRISKRRIRRTVFLSLLALLLLLVAVYFVRFMMHKKSPDAFGSYTLEGQDFDLSLFPSLTVSADCERLRVMQIADPQIKLGYMTRDTKTMDLIDRAISTENPDICVVTGDLTMSIFTYDAYKYFADFMEEREQYWTITWGNHDLEFDSSAYTLWNLLKGYQYCLFDVGPTDVKGDSNFLIPIYREGESIPAYALILLDSGMYPEDRDDLSMVYDSFDESQLGFYRWAIEGLQALNPEIESSLFFHIPVREFADMYYASLGEDSPIDTSSFLPVSGIEGVVGEDDKAPKEYVDEGYTVGIYYQGENAGLYDLVTRLGSTKAIFVGHDHANTLRGYYGDIYLAYGRCCGYHTYPMFDKANFLTDLLGVSDKVYFNGEMWVDENGIRYEKGVTVIDISLGAEDYGTFQIYDKADSELK